MGPINGGGIRGGIDEEEIVVVISGSIGGLGAGAEAKVDGGVFGGPLFAEQLFKFERIVIGKEDVVMSERGILAFDAEEDNKARDGAGRETHLSSDLSCARMLNTFLVGSENIPVVKDEISEDSLA